MNRFARGQSPATRLARVTSEDMLGESINGAIIEDVPQRWRLNRAGIVSEDMLEAVPDSIPRLGLLRWHEAVRSPLRCAVWNPPELSVHPRRPLDYSSHRARNPEIRLR